MIQNVLRNFTGIDTFGIVSLCLFVSVFTGAIIWTMLQKKSHLDAMARVPLDPVPDPAPLSHLQPTLPLNPGEHHE